MKELEVFNPIVLSEERTIELEQLMAEALPVFLKAAKQKYSFAKVKKLRDEYKRDPSSLDQFPQVRYYMARLAEVEQEIISGYICISATLCISFHSISRDPSLALMDFFQEAASAIYDCIYQYNGRHRFSTFAYSSIKLRLISLIRTERRVSGLGRDVQKIRRLVRRQMARDRCTFETAITGLGKEFDLSDDFVERVRMAMFHVQTIPTEEADCLSQPSPPDRSELVEMEHAVETAPLEPLERELVEAHLRRERDYRSYLSKTRVNPKTGRLYTKARLSQIFLGACVKIRRHLTALRHRKAA